MSPSDDDAPSSSDSPEPIRLQRFLASAGLGSRRRCEEYIVGGRVAIDGKTARDLGIRVDPRTQEVRVDGELVRREPLRYFVLHKPRGVVCTNSDPAGRPRAIDLVPAGRLRLFTVGRLDENSEGLILVTNDGDLAHRLAHPRFHVPRTYSIQVAGRPTSETFDELKRGLYFREGRFHVEWIRRTATKGNSTLLEVTLSHGQNREIRRLFARVGHKVMRLRRVRFGPLKLARLAEGKFRPLTTAELQELRGKEPSRRRRRPMPRGKRSSEARGRDEEPARPADPRPRPLLERQRHSKKHD